MQGILKKHWFLIGLTFVFALTLGDPTGLVAGGGRWLRAHRGPDIVIFVIFLFSGLLLNPAQIRAGLTDIRGTLTALLLIFGVAPLLAVVPGKLGLDPGILVGLFLVASMPTTLSSGIVMTGAAGGNMAHALVVTIAANALSVVAVPFILSALLGLVGAGGPVAIDKGAIIFKLAFLVLVPLAAGLFLKSRVREWSERYAPMLSKANQCLILVMVWVAASQSRNAIVASGDLVPTVCILVFCYHGALLLAAFLATKLAGLEPGRRESVIFMGAQKTLTLSVILQVSLFPEVGIALGVCVLHHIIHLMMDGYLVGILANRGATGA